MTKKNMYKGLVSVSTILGIVACSVLYYLYYEPFYNGYMQTEGMFGVVLIILFRIILIFGITAYMFHEWFKQEMQYLSDLPFLFGTFFLILIFGKVLDLLFFVTFFTIDASLFIMKVRFFVAILTLIPMMYLSIGMILYYFSLKNKYEKLNNEKYRNNIGTAILVLIITVEIIAVILATTISAVLILLPLFVLPSIATIVWLFYFSDKNKALSKVNSKILTIGFFLLLISQILRPLAQNILGSTVHYIIFVEVIDLFVFLIIFLGFYMKADYKT